MRRRCPTEARAWIFFKSVGRVSIPSSFIPSPTAPEVTIAEISARTKFDIDGASLDDVAKELGHGPRADEAQRDPFVLPLDYRVKSDGGADAGKGHDNLQDTAENHGSVRAGASDVVQLVHVTV